MAGNWFFIFLSLFGISNYCNCQKPLPVVERFQRILKKAQRSVDIPSSFVPIPGSESHRKDVETAVFSVGMIPDLDEKYFKLFFGTLRKTGFEGDIVVAIDPSTNQSNTELCFKWSPIVYKPDLECKLPNETKWKPADRECRIYGTNDPKVSLNMMRYRLYLWWASKYEKNTNILIADFRDVFFQSNPFLYMPNQWAQPVSQLTVFLEAIPLKAIYRCPFNSGWIRGCYGREALDSVKMNPVSCSGTSLGSRDGILVYTFLMLEQMTESTRVRYGLSGVPVPPDQKCNSIGMDQGLHNWLLHSGRLRRFMRVKVFSQGEGPVNTVGAFYRGKNALLHLDLEADWKVLRGEETERYIANWNGDPSPVVHQLDRFETGRPQLVENLTAVHGVWSPPPVIPPAH